MRVFRKIVPSVTLSRSALLMPCPSSTPALVLSRSRASDKEISSCCHLAPPSFAASRMRARLEAGDDEGERELA